MKMYCAIFFLIILTKAGLGNSMVTENDTETFRVIGGYHEDDIYLLAKYIVSLRVKWAEDINGYGAGHFCGGAIIGNRTILTAAHCLVHGNGVRGGEIMKKPHELVVVAGSAYRLKHESDKGYAKTYKVRKIIKHRDYYPKTMKNDIALLILTEDISFNERTQMAQLADQTPCCWEDCMYAGWGVLFHEGPNPNLINYAKYTIIPEIFESIKKSPPTYDKTGEFGAFSRYGTQACPGDSGGPFFCGNKLTGIASRSYPCIESKQDIGMASYFTKVFHYRDWVARNCTSTLKSGWFLAVFEIFLVLAS